MSRNITVAIWGSNGAGKTTFSAAVAQELTKYYHSVLLVSADRFSPALALWGIPGDPDRAIKEHRKEESFGRILNCPNLTEQYIKERIIPHPGNDRIGVLGYFANEDCESLNAPDGNAALSFINEAKRCMPVTIIDCTVPQTDFLTEKALEYADIVILLLEPNAEGIGFVYAQNSFIRRNLSDSRRYIFLASKVQPDSAVSKFEYSLGVRFEKKQLPFTDEAPYKLNRLELFKKYNGAYADTVAAVSLMIKEEGLK